MQESTHRGEDCYLVKLRVKVPTADTESLERLPRERFGVLESVVKEAVVLPAPEGDGDGE